MSLVDDKKLPGVAVEMGPVYYTNLKAGNHYRKTFFPVRLSVVFVVVKRLSYFLSLYFVAVVQHTRAGGEPFSELVQPIV